MQDAHCPSMVNRFDRFARTVDRYYLSIVASVSSPNQVLTHAARRARRALVRAKCERGAASACPNFESRAHACLITGLKNT